MLTPDNSTSSLQFFQKLESFASPGLTQGLIVNQAGELEKMNIFLILIEKLKSIFGGEDRSASDRVEGAILRSLVEAKVHLDPANGKVVQLVEKLAAQAGLKKSWFSSSYSPSAIRSHEQLHEVVMAIKNQSFFTESKEVSDARIEEFCKKHPKIQKKTPENSQRVTQGVTPIFQAIPGTPTSAEDQQVQDRETTDPDGGGDSKSNKELDGGEGKEGNLNKSANQQATKEPANKEAIEASEGVPSTVTIEEGRLDPTISLKGKRIVQVKEPEGMTRKVGALMLGLLALGSALGGALAFWPRQTEPIPPNPLGGEQQTGLPNKGLNDQVPSLEIETLEDIQLGPLYGPEWANQTAAYPWELPSLAEDHMVSHIIPRSVPVVKLNEPEQAQFGDGTCPVVQDLAVEEFTSLNVSQKTTSYSPLPPSKVVVLNLKDPEVVATPKPESELSPIPQPAASQGNVTDFSQNVTDFSQVETQQPQATEQNQTQATEQNQTTKQGSSEAPAPQLTKEPQQEGMSLSSRNGKNAGANFMSDSEAPSFADGVHDAIVTTAKVVGPVAQALYQAAEKVDEVSGDTFLAGTTILYQAAEKVDEVSGDTFLFGAKEIATSPVKIYSVSKVAINFFDWVGDTALAHAIKGLGVLMLTVVSLPALHSKLKARREAIEENEKIKNEIIQKKNKEIEEKKGKQKELLASAIQADLKKFSGKHSVEDLKAALNVLGEHETNLEVQLIEIQGNLKLYEYEIAVAKEKFKDGESERQLLRAALVEKNRSLISYNENVSRMADLIQSGVEAIGPLASDAKDKLLTLRGEQKAKPSSSVVQSGVEEVDKIVLAARFAKSAAKGLTGAAVLSNLSGMSLNAAESELGEWKKNFRVAYWNKRIQQEEARKQQIQAEIEKLSKLGKTPILRAIKLLDEAGSVKGIEDVMKKLFDVDVYVPGEKPEEPVKEPEKPAEKPAVVGKAAAAPAKVVPPKKARKEEDNEAEFKEGAPMGAKTPLTSIESIPTTPSTALAKPAAKKLAPTKPPVTKPATKEEIAKQLIDQILDETSGFSDKLLETIDLRSPGIGTWEHQKKAQLVGDAIDKLVGSYRSQWRPHLGQLEGPKVPQLGPKLPQLEGPKLPQLEKEGPKDIQEEGPKDIEEEGPKGKKKHPIDINDEYIKMAQSFELDLEKLKQRAKNPQIDEELKIAHGLGKKQRKERIANVRELLQAPEEEKS